MKSKHSRINREPVIPGIMNRRTRASSIICSVGITRRVVNGSKKILNATCRRRTAFNVRGARLKPEALAVTVSEYNIDQLTHLPIRANRCFFSRLYADQTRRAHRAANFKRDSCASRFSSVMSGWAICRFREVRRRFRGGESQRIRLATQIGSSLVGVLYILDEPSIGAASTR